MSQHTLSQTAGAYFSGEQSNTPQNLGKLLRPKDAAIFLGVSRSSLWRLSENDPDFPAKIVITSRCVGWRLEHFSNT